MVREGSTRDIAPTVDPVPGENRRYTTGTATDSSVFHAVPVFAGLGRRFGIAPWPARILLLLMVIPGSPILIYPILWTLMPSEQTVMVQRPQTARPLAARPARSRWAGMVSSAMR